MLERVANDCVEALTPLNAKRMEPMTSINQPNTQTSGKGKSAVQAIPKGYHTVTPFLVVDNAKKVLEFLKKAFDAQELTLMPGETPDKVGHAEVKIGNSIIMMSDAMADQKAVPTMLYLYVEDADAMFKRAKAAGGTVIKEMADQFYGDRCGCLKDAAGNLWWVATHVEDVAPDELQRRHNALAQKKH
jgi:PhnB protein